MAAVTREYLLTCNCVDTRGRMIHEVANPQGLIILAENGKPIMLIGEVSDDTVTNVFIDVAKGTGGLITLDCMSSEYEILAEHDNMLSDFVPNWRPDDEGDTQLA